jgi:hypothetical protein
VESPIRCFNVKVVGISVCNVRSAWKVFGWKVPRPVFAVGLVREDTSLPVTLLLLDFECESVIEAVGVVTTDDEVDFVECVSL